MPRLFDIKNHLIFYRKYHFNPTNVAIHFVCIPIILLSAISLFIGNVVFPQYPYPSVGVLTAWAYGVYYMILDWQLGIPTFLFLIGFAHVQRMFYSELGLSSVVSKTQFKQIALGAHIVCWVVQFYGHAVHEKRAPALFDNLVQALVLAPFFVVYEIAFWLGFKLDVRNDMDNQAGKLVKEMMVMEEKKQK